jgi:serine-type D-Ala-D-Ala carboxypeptidase/endopeptidase
MRFATIFLLSRFVFAQSGGEIQALVDNRVETAKKAVGMVVGTIDAAGSHIYSGGATIPHGAQKPDAQTLFEIASLTKVFTSLLLADMIERNEVKADDPVAKYLPPGAVVPSRNGKQITLLNLSMQNSGLPLDPDNLDSPTGLYDAYDERKLLSFLGTYKLTRDPGEKFEDSNVGVGLLGFVLARRANLSYEELLRQRIFRPLHMNASTISLSEDQKQHLAKGSLGAQTVIANWDKSAVAGTGGIRSTAEDMLKFLAANMGLVDTPLKTAMQRMRSVRASGTNEAHQDIAMTWFVWNEFPPDIYMVAGATIEQRSFAGMDIANKKAVVILCTSNFWIQDVIGRHLLRASYPAPMLEKMEDGTPFDAKIVSEYQGTYDLQVGPKLPITFTARDGRLFAQFAGQPESEFFQSKKDEIFSKDVDAQAIFTRDFEGKVTGVVFHQNGQYALGPRAKQ